MTSLDSDGDRKTWPPAGTANLKIKQETVPLFYSAVWVIRARVDGKVIFESKHSGEEYSSAFTRQWARYCIRKKYSQLREFGVNADHEYENWGGLSRDIILDLI